MVNSYVEKNYWIIYLGFFCAMNTEAEMGATCLSSVDILLNSADLDIIP